LFGIAEIQKALAQHRPAVTSLQVDRNCAAVAMVLAGDEPDLRLCVIRRAHKPGDPWSGHMAFPGGRASPQDMSLQAAAERETHEEVGLVLEPSQRLGSLSPLSIWLSGREQPLFLFPFVYYLGQFPSALTLNHEVAEAYWLPLVHLWDGRNGTSLSLSTDNTSLRYPAIRFREQTIWGITLRVLTLFSDVLGRPLPHLEEIPGLGH
jgi:8-oxo-dGTP pyrophosphatase MutT (NUDIX family)